VTTPIPGAFAGEVVGVDRAAPSTADVRNVDAAMERRGVLVLAILRAPTGFRPIFAGAILILAGGIYICCGAPLRRIELNVADSALFD
jgi:2-keto-4-pentenoate hydratase